MEKQEMGQGTLEDLLEKLGISKAAGLSEEPVTLHRRGQWFEPTTAQLYFRERL